MGLLIKEGKLLIIFILNTLENESVDRLKLKSLCHYTQKNNVYVYNIYDVKINV